MIEVLEKRGDSVKSQTLDTFSLINPTWINSVNSTNEELQKLSEISKIPLSELRQCTDKDERPHITEGDAYSLLVFKAPYETQDIRSVRGYPVFIFLFGTNSILTLSTKDLDSLKRLKTLIHNGAIKQFESSGSILKWICDEIVKDYFIELDILEDRVEKVEDMLLKTHDKKIIHTIFSIKKKMIYLHKSLLANREVISGIEKEYVKQVAKKDAKKFRDIYNDIVQLIDMGDTYREILTGVLDTHLTSISNNLNEVMKKLTVYASFVMVPTLISGIYGMNFRVMPELYWQYGYIFALGLMVFSIFGLYIFFKQKKWI